MLTIMKIISILSALFYAAFGAVAYAAEKTTIFEGNYEYRTDAESLEIIGEQVCFFPSKPSSANVPRPAGDNRLPWFCFTNSKQAARLLGFELHAKSNGCGFSGKAEVRVHGYERYTGEGDENDVATLDAVLEKTPPVSLPCAK